MRTYSRLIAVLVAASSCIVGVCQPEHRSLNRRKQGQGAMRWLRKLDLDYVFLPSAGRHVDINFDDFVFWGQWGESTVACARFHATTIDYSKLLPE
jgi:hypothetical protein